MLSQHSYCSPPVFWDLTSASFSSINKRQQIESSLPASPGGSSTFSTSPREGTAVNLPLMRRREGCVGWITLFAERLREGRLLALHLPDLIWSLGTQSHGLYRKRQKELTLIGLLHRADGGQQNPCRCTLRHPDPYHPLAPQSMGMLCQCLGSAQFARSGTSHNWKAFHKACQRSLSSPRWQKWSLDGHTLMHTHCLVLPVA